MRFVELVELFALDKGGLKILLCDGKWQTYREWHNQWSQVLRDRTRLYAIIPEELAVAAMKKCKL